MSKKSFLWTFLLVVSCLFLLCACSPDLTFAAPKAVSMTVDGIEMTEYTAGDSLLIDGAQIHVVYNNNKTQVFDLTEEMIDKTSFDMTQPGEQTVVVRYAGVSASFDIVVTEWRLSSIELLSQPYVTRYVAGQPIDLAGATVRMNFEKGLDKSEEKTSDFALTEDMLDEYDPYRLGEQTINAFYYGEILSFRVYYEEKTPTSISVVDSAENNFVYIGMGQYVYAVHDGRTGKPLDAYGATVDGNDFAGYATLAEAEDAAELFVKAFGGTYTTKIHNRYDLSGMSLRVGYDNEQTPLYDVATGASKEGDYRDVPDLKNDLYVSIDDSVERTVEAILLYLPEDYPTEFTYTYYGNAYVKVGGTVQPDMELASNHIVRDGKEITLDAVLSKSYGKVTSMKNNADGMGTITVSAYMPYNLTTVAVKPGDIIADNTMLGTYGTSSVFSIGGGIVDEVRDDGTVIIRTAPTTTFTSKTQGKAYKEMAIVNIDDIMPTKYADTTTIKNMIQGDTIDLATGQVRVTYDDGTVQTFSLNSSMISVVNAGAETVNQPLDIAEPGWYELWLVYGGVPEHHVSLYVGVEGRYPTNMYIVPSTDTISGQRFFVGDTISIGSLQYYIKYNNETTSDYRQVTEDMLADGMSLYCAEGTDGGVYQKTIRFRLPEEDAALLEEDAEEIFADAITCRVVPQPMIDSRLEVIREATKVYVAGAEKIDLTGAVYSVTYRNNETLLLYGSEITANAGEMSTGGKAQMTFTNEAYDNLYISDECKLYVYSEAETAANPSLIAEKTKIGRRCIGRLTYYDPCYTDYQQEVADDSFVYFEKADIYACYTDFYYYLIENEEWLLTSIKVTLDVDAGVNICKTNYVQYEDWDLAGVYVTLSVGNSSRKINATADMIYDSDTNTLTEGDTLIPVKFYFLGATDDTTLQISVGPRSETGLAMIAEGKTAYLTTQSLDFSEFTFYTYYNAGPYEPIKTLRGVSSFRQNDGWWYALYQKLYVVYNADGEIVDEDGNVSTIIDAGLTTLDAAERRIAALNEDRPGEKFTTGWEKGGALSSDIANVIGEVLVELHHSVAAQNTDVSTVFSISVSSNTYDVVAVRYIGSDEDISAEVPGKYIAGYGMGNQYAVLDRYGRAAVLYSDGNGVYTLGYVSEDGSVVTTGEKLYFATQKESEEACARLLALTLAQTTTGYYIANGNGKYVDEEGRTGYTPYFVSLTGKTNAQARDEAESMRRRILALSRAPYKVMSDSVTGKYVLADTYGSFVTENGYKLLYYYNSEDDANEYADILNGIVCENEKYYVKRGGDYLNEVGLAINDYMESGASRTKAIFDTAAEARAFLYETQIYRAADTYYYLVRNGNYLNANGDEIVEGVTLSAKKSFVTLQEAENFLRDTNKLSSMYTVSNTVYVLGEVAAGWDVMMTEYIGDVLTVKTLTVYYADGTVGNVPITPEMLSYDKIDSSTGYRRIAIKYRNHSCDVYIYVWRATLTGVDINETHKPLTNYIRNAEQDVSTGILNLTFTKFNARGVSVGYMMKYIAMTDSDISYSGFRTDIYSKTGVKVTVGVQYRDYDYLSTSYVITVYDLQDIPFVFNNTIFFYGNVSEASFGMDTGKQIPEFAFPSENYIRMDYIQSKNLIPYKQFLQMNLTKEERSTYFAVKGYDENMNLDVLYYISADSLETDEAHPFDPASGTYYVIYSAYVLKSASGEVLERMTATEYAEDPDSVLTVCTQEQYEALSAGKRALYIRSERYTLGDIVYSAEEYAALPPESQALVNVSYIYTLTKRSLTQGYTGEAVRYVYTPEQYAKLDERYKGICTHYVYARFAGECVSAFFTQEEYDAMSATQREGLEPFEFYVIKKSRLVPVTLSGDILYSYSKEEYAALPSELSALCEEINNVYYLFVRVDDPNNKYYENANYCLQEFSIIPKVIDVSVVTPSENAYVLRVTTANNPSAIAYLHNPTNLDALSAILYDETNEKYKVEGTTFKSLIKEISLMSPNEDYFELRVEAYAPSAKAKTAASSVFYFLLKTMYESTGIANIKVGKEKSDFNTNASESACTTLIGGALEVGVNMFTEVKSDVEYDISYSVTYGELLKRKGVLQLLSGRLLLSYDESVREYTAVCGTLGHGSYTIDLTPIVFSMTGKKELTVHTRERSETDLLIRVYMPNAHTVYSSWVLGGDFAKLRAEMVGENGSCDFLSDIAILSPNREYFELVFTPNDLWTGSDEQKERIYSVLNYMKNYGVTKAYLGKDLHLYESGSEYVTFDADASFSQTASFDTTVKNVSDEMLSFAHMANDFYAGISDSVALSCETTEYVLRVDLISNWRGVNSQKEALAKAIYHFLADKLTLYGNVLYGGKEINECNESDFFALVDREVDLVDYLYIKVPFTYLADSDKLYAYIRNNFETDKNALSDEYEGIRDMSILTAEPVTTVKFLFTKPVAALTDPQKDALDELYKNFLADMKEGFSVDRLYYGSDTFVFTQTSGREEFVAAFDRIVQTGVNIFRQNRCEIYDVTYYIDTADLLQYSGIYMLLTGGASVDTSVVKTGEFSAEAGTLADGDFYVVQYDGLNGIMITE